jgi:DNA-directed RNA polymerase specialized sigma subunit
MMTNSETGRAPDVQSITLDAIKELHDQTTWPAVKRTKAQRDQLIREALAAGTFTARQIAEALGISEQHVGRIEKGQTSGAAPYRGNARTDTE